MNIDTSSAMRDLRNIVFLSILIWFSYKINLRGLIERSAKGILVVEYVMRV